MGGNKSKLYKNYAVVFNAPPNERTSGIHAPSHGSRELVETVGTGNCFAGYPKNILSDKQGRHIPGHKNYLEGRSILTLPLPKLQKLVDRLSGMGQVLSESKERVNFEVIIGIYISKYGDEKPTTWGIIHHALNGLHVVPSEDPNQ